MDPDEINEMLDNLALMLKLMEKRSDIFTITARLLKKEHAALQTAGFSSAEATAIVAGQGLGAKINQS